MKRRNFIKAAALAAPVMSLFPADLSAIAREMAPGKIEKRSLGKTGKMLSVIGFGGIIVRDATPAEASQRVKSAIDAGINYFDVAPSYGDAEFTLGPALAPYRKNVFLACKTQGRTKAESRAELEESLKRAKTDHFDLYQFHAVKTMEEVDAITGKGGALETFIEARKEGKINLIGFSAHTVEAAMALMDRFDFDSILFPVNYVTWNAGDFGPQVLAKAQEKKVGILALKAAVKGPWKEGPEQKAARKKYPKCWYEPLTTPEDISMGLRFTLSHPVTSAIPSGDENLFKIVLQVANNITPLKKNEVEEIKKKGLASTPLFKYEG